MHIPTIKNPPAVENQNGNAEYVAAQIRNLPTTKIFIACDSNTHVFGSLPVIQISCTVMKVSLCVLLEEPEVLTEISVCNESGTYTNQTR